MTGQEVKNVQTVEKLNELVNTRNYAEMTALFAEGYIDNNPGWKIDSVDGLIELIKGASEAFDMQNEIVETIAAGNMVFVHIKNHGTHKRAAFGVAPTGKPTVMTTFEIYRFEDEKIAERWVTSDAMSLANQLGVELPFQPNAEELTRLYNSLDMKSTVNITFSAGGRVVSHITMNGKHTNDFMGISATGNDVSWTGIEVCGTETRTAIDDLASLCSQMGVGLPS